MRTHPATGRKAVFVNCNLASHIVGISRLERDVLREIFLRRSEHDEFKCRFKWQPCSIACWHNRCTMRLAMWDCCTPKRHGHRVTMSGTEPCRDRALPPKRRDGGPSASATAGGSPSARATRLRRRGLRQKTEVTLRLHAQAEVEAAAQVLARDNVGQLDDLLVVVVRPEPLEQFVRDVERRRARAFGILERDPLGVRVVRARPVAGKIGNLL